MPDLGLIDALQAMPQLQAAQHAWQAQFGRQQGDAQLREGGVDCGA